MKSTKNKAFSATSSLKIGLSLILATFLLASAPQPLFAGTTDKETAIAALFELDEKKLPEAPEAESPNTVQEALLKVCTDRGYGQVCAQHLLGMLWKESNNIANAIGDRGKARGYFQIWVKLHKISVECAEDLECSANWTISYLERNQYAKYPMYAIQCHNGCNIENGYAASAVRHGKRLWERPLAIVKTTEVALAR